MKRWALISGGVVANVVEQEAAPTIGGTWVESATAGPGWLYTGGAFVAPSPAVPTVTRRQALRALNAAGLLDDVEVAINNLPEPERAAARIDWDNALDFRRDFPLVLQLGAALGLTAAQLDDLFAAAAAIE